MTRTCSLRCGRMRSDWHVRRARTSNGTTPPRTSTRHGPGATVGPVAHAGSSAGSVRRWPADRRASGRFDPEPSEEIADGRNLEPSSGTRRAPPRSTAKAVAPAEPCEDVLNLVERRLRRTYQPAVTHKDNRSEDAQPLAPVYPIRQALEPDPSRRSVPRGGLPASPLRLPGGMGATSMSGARGRASPGAMAGAAPLAAGRIAAVPLASRPWPTR